MSFLDWNGNGSKNDLMDNLMDMHMLDEMDKGSNGSRRNNNNGCCGGTCLMVMIMIPVWAPVALIMNALGIIKV